MVHRRDLIPRFEWLAGSIYYEDALDEALLSIALAARGLQHEMIEYGAAWASASYVIEIFGLEDLVERSRADLGPFAPTVRAVDDKDPSD
ncbi:MAG TPA: hypothetical protein VH042_01720 [Solirubrobacterales bacterium]|jgi:hypothetical protein|nr:hypothetical protein [Solirubrobacterales bacterium]